MMEYELVTIARRDEPGLKEKLRELVKMIVDDDYHYTVQTIDDAIATLKALKPLRKMHRFDDFPFLPPPILITDPVILATGQSGLGHDLVSEILMRLPVKSLMRFKCVHRSFNALFRTPTFITGHMMMQKLKHKEERLVIFENYEKPHCMISDDPSQSPINLEFEIPSTKPLRHVVPYTSSHRGIFCLYVQYDSFSPAGDFILWNPATREVKLVTPPPSYIPAIMGNVVGYDLFFGFGGDPDLSIVAFVLDNENLHHYPSAEMYNLSTNSWTFIKDSVVPLKNKDLIINSYAACGVPRSGGTLANGICHWLVCDWLCGLKTENTCILCFDFRNNQFRKVELPPQVVTGCPFNPPAGDIHEPFLDVVNDSIAFVLPRLLTWWEAEIWILEQENCWTKKYKFGPLDWQVPIYTIWKDGAEFLGPSGTSSTYCLGDHLVSYNSDGQAVRHFDDVSRSSSFMREDVLKYVESITPLSFF